MEEKCGHWARLFILPISQYNKNSTHIQSRDAAFETGRQFSGTFGNLFKPTRYFTHARCSSHGIVTICFSDNAGISASSASKVFRNAIMQVNMVEKHLRFQNLRTQRLANTCLVVSITVKYFFFIEECLSCMFDFHPVKIVHTSGYCSHGRSCTNLLLGSRRAIQSVNSTNRPHNATQQRSATDVALVSTTFGHRW